MQYPYTDDFDLPRQAQVVRYLKAAAWIAVGLMVVAIALLALTHRPAEPLPVAPSTESAGVTEHRYTLTDGRTLHCLHFPGPSQPVSCDWSRAFNR
jgi:multisubunit Na+/H+ antiporter MnhB subunit